MERLMSTRQILEAGCETALGTGVATFLLHFSACESGGKRAKHVENLQRPWQDAVTNCSRLSGAAPQRAREQAMLPVRAMKGILIDTKSTMDFQPPGWRSMMPALYEAALPRLEAFERGERYILAVGARKRDLAFQALGLVAMAFFLDFNAEKSWDCGKLGSRFAKLPMNAVPDDAFLEELLVILVQAKARAAAAPGAQAFPQLLAYYERIDQELQKCVPARV